MKREEQKGTGETNPLLAHVARLHYLEGLNKGEIGTRLGISRFKVARLLDEAREQEIVRVEITDPLATDAELGEGLARRFGLTTCVVARADDADALARAAAAWLPQILDEGGSLGVAWGTTLQGVLECLSPEVAREGRDVVQICGGIPSLQPGAGPTELTMHYAEAFGGTPYTLPAPALTAPAVYAELRRNDVVRPTLEEFDRVGSALVGIGAGKGFPGAPAKAVAHILVHLFDADGELVPPKGDQAALAMSVEQLRKVRLIAVAGGAAKREPVLAALRSGLLDALFTDADVARFALDATD